MRAGYYEDENGAIVNGYWHHSAIKAGELYQMRKSQQWMVVETVQKMKGPEDNNWFCTLRPATATEIPQPMSKEDAKRIFDDFFDAMP